PFSPKRRKWKIGKKPNLSRALITDPDEKLDTATPAIAVSNTMVAAKVSATKVIPNGASQLPDCIVWDPCCHTDIRSHTEIPRLRRLPIILIVFCQLILLHTNMSTIARSS